MKYIIELEGYSLSFGFCVKECSILNLSNMELIHFFVKPSCKFEMLSAKDKRIVGYTERNLHNIYWEAGRHRFQDLVDWISKNISPTGIIYTKGANKLKFLECRLAKGMKVTNLETLGCPALGEVLKDVNTSEFTSCPLPFHNGNPQCTHLKVQCLSSFFSRPSHEPLFTTEQNVSSGSIETEGFEEEGCH
jgi:hypothetical protein